MMRSYIGNRVFTVKHNRAKLCRGPLTGHVRPIVKQLPSFDGSSVYRIVCVPHDMRDFDHDMWVRRRNKLTDRLHKGDICETFEHESEECFADSSEDTPVSAPELFDADDVQLSFLEDGRLGFASFGSDDNEALPLTREHTPRRSTRKDWVRSARQMC